MRDHDHDPRRGPDSAVSSADVEIGRAGRLTALGVHLFTASGAALGFLALLSAIDRDFTAMFAWLAAALFVDGIDGSIARKARVRDAAPNVSGDTLDLVVDYVTYVLVPAYGLFVSGLLPEGAAGVAATLAILVSAALYFALTDMKTPDLYFRGFPAIWNVAAFYLFLLALSPWANVAIVAALVGLSFAPFAFVHPFRVKRLRLLTLVLLVLWGALALCAIAQGLKPDGFVIGGLVALALYFTGLGLIRSREEPASAG